MSSQQLNDPLIGRVIAGKIRIERHLGSGATGSVYLAHHLALAKPVAIKVLHATHAVDLELVRRFKSEARAASRLDHSNSVRILDFGQEDDDRLLYIAMEYLDGEDLQTVLERNPRFDAKRIASIMAQVCGALAVAHDHGVIHRDMKPGNIMLVRDPDDETQREVVKVCDFGLAKVLDVNPDEMTGGPLTKQGMIFGTPTYMSPEQASGDALDHRSDIYSCGVIMYRLATGHPPFTAENATGLLIKQIMEHPTPVLKKNPSCDPRIAAIIERAMHKARDARYQSMREMLEDLRAVLADGKLSQPRVQAFREPIINEELSEPAVVVDDTIIRRPGSVSVLPPPSIPPRSTSPVAIAVIGSLALVAAGGLATFLYLDSQKPDAAMAIANRPMDPSQPASPPVKSVAQRTPAPRAKPEVATATKAVEQPMETVEKPTGAVEEPIEAVENPTETVEKPIEEALEKIATKAEKKKTKKKKEEETIAETPPAVEPPPPAVEQPPPSAPPPPVQEAPPPVETPPPPPAEEAPPPASPEKLAHDFELETSIAELQLQGGISKKKLKTALDRSLGAVRECLRNVIAEQGVPVKGKIDVKGTIGSQGRFQELEASGGVDGAADCAQTHLKSARLPSADTGDIYLTFCVRYSTAQ